VWGPKLEQSLRGENRRGEGKREGKGEKREKRMMLCLA
jgi:hypothetical protein